jgi:hypothetical protein
MSRATRRGLPGVSEQAADAAVEATIPGGVGLALKTAGIIPRLAPVGEPTWRLAVVTILAADAGLLEDEWASQHVLQLANSVPGFLEDLREARRMGAEMDAIDFGQFLTGCTTGWPGAPVRVLRALAALRPDLGELLRQRARHLGRPDVLNFDHQEGIS